MQTPLRITYRHTNASAALEERIRQHLADLEHCCERIVDCHITVELPPGRRRSCTPEVNIDLTVPGRRIAVHSGPANRATQTDIDMVLADAFTTLRRLLQDFFPAFDGAQNTA